ncbi:MAG: XRE family transcriptional regulator [Candidatus Brocadiaceae bacterium]|nr:XRE family transcriptional regulator [Candidatus Brocadiaceae bacterium]
MNSFCNCFTTIILFYSHIADKDLGFNDPEEYRAKAELALQISKIIEKRNLTQAEAAKLIGAAQPDISKLKNGQLGGVTIDRFLGFLRHLANLSN